LIPRKTDTSFLFTQKKPLVFMLFVIKINNWRLLVVSLKL
jgi:hypothetical protein